MQQFELVAHRGYAAQYPENSLSAFQAAIDCGCRFLELDVQLSKDMRAVVIHDTTLTRTGESDINILESHWSVISNEKIGENEKFSGRFPTEKIMSLDDFTQLLRANPKVHVFVEIKEECVDFFGVDNVLDVVNKTIESVKEQCTIISFHADVLFEAKKRAKFPIGYVIHRFDQVHLETVKKLSPDMVICNYRKIPDKEGSLWKGPWDWFLYEIIDPELALKWANRGVKYIETMQIAPMITSLKMKR